MTTRQGAAPVETRLADLICADPDLLRAEFDAIISAGWGSYGPTGRPAPPPAPGPPLTERCPHPHPSGPPVARRLRRRAGQRAPPSSPTLDTESAQRRRET